MKKNFLFLILLFSSILLAGYSTISHCVADEKCRKKWKEFTGQGTEPSGPVAVGNSYPDFPLGLLSELSY